MKIAFVSAFPPGKLTLNEYGYHFAKALADNPQVDEVIILADILPQPEKELSIHPKIRVERVWTFNTLLNPIKITKAIKRCRPDGVIFNIQTASFGDNELSAAAGLCAPMLSSRSGYVTGIIAHNLLLGIDLESTLLKGKKLRQMIVSKGGDLITYFMMKADYMTVTLESYLKEMSQRYPKGDISLVPHGTFDTGVQDLPEYTERPMRMVTMGKFGTYKKLETTIAAFQMLKKSDRFSSLELIIGGTDHPNALGYIEDLKTRHANTPGLSFTGYVAEEDVPPLFGNAKIAIFDYTSTTGSSGVLHQAASFGCVPVYPYIGDFIDVTEKEGIQGNHFTPEDPQSMADAIGDLLENSEKSATISTQNYDTAQDMPISEIARFHVDKISAHSGRQ